MTKLSKEQQMQIMHTVNQSIADDKIVIAGSYRIYGAIYYYGELCFLVSTGIMHRNPFDSPLPLVASRAENFDKKVVRAFTPTKTDVDVIYEPPPVANSTAAENPDLSNPSP